jgi:hypothetical protein
MRTKWNCEMELPMQRSARPLPRTRCGPIPRTRPGKTVSQPHATCAAARKAHSRLNRNSALPLLPAVLCRASALSTSGDAAMPLSLSAELHCGAMRCSRPKDRDCQERSSRTHPRALYFYSIEFHTQSCKVCPGASLKTCTAANSVCEWRELGARATVCPTHAEGACQHMSQLCN